jgi:hypothetical protein
MRRRICDPQDRTRLLAALATAAETGSRLDAPDLARLPPGFAAPGDWEHLLRRRHLVQRTQGMQAVPDWLFSAEAPARIAALARAHLPLLSWLAGAR